MAIKSFPLKMRARFGGARLAAVSRLEKTERKLERVNEEILAEIAGLEHIKKSYLKQPHFSWMTGQLSILTVQDFVGAAFGAIFFAASSEVWALAKNLSIFSMFALIVISYLLGFSLIHLSRRRKFIGEQLRLHSIARSLEIYFVSFVTSLLFIYILGTAHDIGQLFPQAVLVTLPAVVSAATADLLFF